MLRRRQAVTVEDLARVERKLDELHAKVAALYRRWAWVEGDDPPRDNANADLIPS